MFVLKSTYISLKNVPQISKQSNILLTNSSGVIVTQTFHCIKLIKCFVGVQKFVKIESTPTRSTGAQNHDCKPSTNKTFVYSLNQFTAMFAHQFIP